jgi:hypothetical protein
MNALLAAELAASPKEFVTVGHPVQRIVVSVDSSGSKTFMDVYGEIDLYKKGGYREKLFQNGHEIYCFYSPTPVDMDERAAVWRALKIDRLFGHANKRRCVEEIRALDPVDIYGFDECLVCYEKTQTKTVCRHPVCVPCMSRLQECPVKCGPIDCHCCQEN